MALPTKPVLFQLDWSLNGTPFVNVTANDSINTNQLDWSLDGTLFWAGGLSDVPPSENKIFHGSNAVTKIYIGAGLVSKVYVGSTFIQ